MDLFAIGEVIHFTWPAVLRVLLIGGYRESTKFSLCCVSIRYVHVSYMRTCYRLSVVRHMCIFIPPVLIGWQRVLDTVNTAFLPFCFPIALIPLSQIALEHHFQLGPIARRMRSKTQNILFFCFIESVCWLFSSCGIVDGNKLPDISIAYTQ